MTILVLRDKTVVVS